MFYLQIVIIVSLIVIIIFLLKLATGLEIEIDMTWFEVNPRWKKFKREIRVIISFLLLFILLNRWATNCADDGSRETYFR